METRITPLIDWTPIGQTSNQLILYHPPSHALSVQPHPTPSLALPGPSRRPLLLSSGSATSSVGDIPLSFPASQAVPEQCPYCHRPMPLAARRASRFASTDETTSAFNHVPTDRREGLRGDKRGYFQILEVAHESSRPGSPAPTPRRRRSTTALSEVDSEGDILDERDGVGVGVGVDAGPGSTSGAEGYYEKYFREEKRLGIGAEGSVFLATHIIGGNVLGTYAVKKIAVGTSSSYLVKMLREVRLLETLRHPNVIPYHHAWIDVTRFSSFGPPITALHVLMMYATAGNLDSFLLSRSYGDDAARQENLTAGQVGDAESLGRLPKEERIKAFKRRRQMSQVAREQGSTALDEGRGRRKQENRGVLLLSWEEIVKLFGDVVEGLAYLHANSILHLDLKCSNVLLHWEEGKLIPKAMISDFGTSEEMLRGRRDRTGHTGTMEYMAPETLVANPQGHFRPADSHADLWSLGMILHKMIFLHLPYGETEDFGALMQEILRYPGFLPSTELVKACERRHIPRDMLLLLSKLIHIDPEARPTAEKVRLGIQSLASRSPTTNGTSSNTFGTLVTRFARPLDGMMRRTPSAPVAHSDSSRGWDHSPVRPILALPSPVREASPFEELSSAALPAKSESAGWRPGKRVRMGLLAFKIISLHWSPMAHRLLPVVVIFLVVMALLDLEAESWWYTAAALVLHVGIIWGPVMSTLVLRS